MFGRRSMIGVKDELCLEAGERRPDAEVDPLPEGEVA